MKQLFSFRGRATRMQWWAIWLAVAAFGYLTGYVGAWDDVPTWLALWLLVMAPALAWIGCAVSARRWHDIDRPGWMCLVFFIPVVGPLFVLIFNGFIGGDAGDNRYGAPAL